MHTGKRFLIPKQVHFNKTDQLSLTELQAKLKCYDWTEPSVNLQWCWHHLRWRLYLIFIIAPLSGTFVERVMRINLKL